MTEVIEYQDHLNSHSEIVGFIGLVGLRPMDHSNLNIYWNVKKGKKNVYVAKNGDTGEKIKHCQSNPVVWIYRFLNGRQDAGSYYFVALLNYPRLSPSRATPYFLFRKYIAFSNITNCMFKRDIEFRPFHLFVRQFVCNLKIPLRNSVITPFKF